MPKTTTKRATKKKVAKRPMVARRDDLGANADGYFKDIGPAELNQAAAKLRSIVKAAAPKASEAIKWGMPVFELNGMLCYIKAWGSYVTLGFYHQGVYLPDPDKLLEGTGDKMRHVKIRSTADIKAGLFTNWVKQAVAINLDS